MAIRKFRRGESTYRCRVCHKTTRNVSGDEYQVQLCRDCFDLSGIENHLSDSGDLGGYADEARDILARRIDLRNKFPEVTAAVNPDWES